MTVRELVKCCMECEALREPLRGLEVCEGIIQSGAKGRLLVTALRYQARFLLMAHPGWENLAASLAKEALLKATHPEDQAAIYSYLVAIYSGGGSIETATEYAEQFFRLARMEPVPGVTKWTPKVWFNLGYGHDARLQYDAAIAAYENAVDSAFLSGGEFNPGYAAHNLVQMYLETGRTDLAVASLEKASLLLAGVGESARDKDQEAQLLLAQGRLEEAEGLCESVLNEPDLTQEVLAEVLLTRARIAVAQGLHDKAVALGTQARKTAYQAVNVRLVHKVEGFLRTLR